MNTNRKVLIVDDEAHIRRVMEVKIKKGPYQVLLAKNGQEGLHLIETQNPDVVIVDINMPVMDGKTLCEKTNMLKKERPFLTIVITARIFPGDREWAESMEDTLFLEKPFSPAEMMKHIEQYQGHA